MKSSKLPWSVFAGTTEDPAAIFGSLRNALIFCGVNGTGTNLTRVGHRGVLWVEGKERVDTRANSLGEYPTLDEAIAIVDGRIELQEQKDAIRAEAKAKLAALMKGKDAK